MAENELKAKISADIADFKKKITEADRLLNSYANRIENVKKIIDKNLKSTRDFERQIKQLNAQFKNGKISQTEYNKQVEKLQNSHIKSNQAIRNSQKELRRLQGEYKRVNNAIKNGAIGQKHFADSTKNTSAETKKLADNVKQYSDKTKLNALPITNSLSRAMSALPSGISSVGSALVSLTNNLSKASTQAGGAQNAFKAIVSSLTGPAGIAAGVSIVIGAMTALIRSGTTVTDVLAFFGSETAKAAKLQNELNKAMRDGVADAQVQMIEIKALAGIMQDANVSLQDRERAYNRLNEIHPAFLKGLSEEEALTSDLTDRTEELTKALLRQAQIKGLEDVIVEKYKEIAKKLQDEPTFWEIIWASIKSPLTPQATGLKILESRLEDVSKLGKEAESLAQSLTSLIQEDFLDPFGSGSEGLDKKIKENIKRLKATISSELKRQESIPTITMGIDISEGVDRDRVKAMAETLHEDLRNELLKLKALKAIEFKSNIDIENISETENKIQDLYAIIKQLQDSLKDGIIPTETFKEASEHFGIAKDTFAEYAAMLERSVKIREQAEEQSKKWALTWTDLGRSISDSMGSIIRSLARGSNSMDDFGRKLADIVSDIISKALAASMAQAIMGGTSSGAATGAGAIGAIPAMIATLTAVVAAAFGKLKFASGGIVPGGSFVGDKVPIMANGGEMILNNRQQQRLFNLLNGQIGGMTSQTGTLDIRVHGEISGETIKLSSDRYERKRNRLN